MKEKCGLAAVLWACLWYAMVQMQRRFGQIKPVMGMYLMAVYGFLSVLVFGAYSAAEMHVYP